jgi:hypothetical protein
MVLIQRKLNTGNVSQCYSLHEVVWRSKRGTLIQNERHDRLERRRKNSKLGGFSAFTPKLLDIITKYMSFGFFLYLLSTF